jgi:hypothetical protein
VRIGSRAEPPPRVVGVDRLLPGVVDDPDGRRVGELEGGVGGRETPDPPTEPVEPPLDEPEPDPDPDPELDPELELPWRGMACASANAGAASASATTSEATPLTVCM